MKRLIFFISALFLISCQSNDNGGGNRLAITPLGLGCLNGTNYCNNTMYNQYPGWSAYPGYNNYGYNPGYNPGYNYGHNQNYSYMNYYNQHGFCNCPAGYLPSYNGTYGLGCVNAQLIQPYAGAYFYWQFGAGTGYQAPQTSINYPQFSNVPGAASSGLCSHTLTQSCLLDQYNTCSIGARCQPVNPGSRLGICVRY